MPKVIKASDRQRGAQHVAFNFDDMAARANDYLAKVRAEAAQIIAKARQEADAIKKQAEVEGRKAGQAAVAQMVQAQLGRQLATLLPALKQAVEDLRQARQAWLAHWEKSGVRVAAAIARRVVRRELSQHPEITVQWLREALELAAGSPQLRIHLHPGDHETLGPQVQMVLQEIAPLAEAQIVPDPEISPGGCRVETRFGTIDQQVETQLARIEEELG